MIRLNPVSSLFLSIFVFISWTLFSPCHANNSGLLAGFPTAGSQNKGNNSLVPLAAKRTHRIDPMNDFKYYDGGWDITNTHYLLSVAFSGIPLVVVGVLWCFLAAFYFTIIACYCCCCRKSRSKHSQKTFAISLIFLSLFLIMTVIGGVFLFIGLGKFQDTARVVSDILVTRAHTVVDIIRNVLDNLSAAKNIQVAGFNLPDDIKQGIEKAESFSSQTDFIKHQSEQTARLSLELIEAINQILIAVGTMMLALAAVGFMISIFGWEAVVYTLLFFGWILVTTTFILSGISLIVHNGVADTCVAMEDWVQHPRENSALSKLLPCMDENAAQKTLDITRNTSFQVINLLNTFLTDIANSNDPPKLDNSDINYNQSGPAMPLLCNPLHSNLTERTCDASEVNLKGAPNAYQSYLCNTSPSGVCISMGRLTPSLYSKIMVATNLSDTLHLHGPLLARLVDCSFVVETFDHINKGDCSSFKRYSNQIFIGLVLVSFGVMFSVILWVVFVRERQLQLSLKKLKRTSVEVQ